MGSNFVVVLFLFAIFASSKGQQFGILWSQNSIFETQASLAMISLPSSELIGLVSCWSQGTCTQLSEMQLKKAAQGSDLIIFLQPGLDLAQFSYLANAYSEKKDGGSFRFLRDETKNKPSLTWTSNQQTEAFARQLIQEGSSLENVKIYSDSHQRLLPLPAGAYSHILDQQLENTQSLDHKVHIVVLPSVQETLDLNGKMKEADALVEKFLQNTGPKSYVAAFLSINSKIKATTAEDQEDPSFLDYFTPEVIIILIFSFLLLFILYTGLSCLYSIQTPSRFYVSRDQTEAKNK